MRLFGPMNECNIYSYKNISIIRDIKACGGKSTGKAAVGTPLVINIRLFRFVRNNFD